MSKLSIKEARKSSNVKPVPEFHVDWVDAEGDELIFGKYIRHGGEPTLRIVFDTDVVEHLEFVLDRLRDRTE